MSRLDELIEKLCPDGVEMYELQELFITRNGYTPSKSKSEFWENGTVPWFKMEDIRANGNILSDALQHVNECAVKGKLFPGNSIIVATSATVGEHALITVPSLANQRFTYLMVKPEYEDRFMPKFLFYYCYKLDKYCLQNLNQSSFASVDMKKFAKFKFPVPPLEVQREIVYILDSFTLYTDEIIKKLTDELTARKKQYEFYRDTLLKHNNTIEKTTIGEISEFVTVGIANSATQAYKDNGVVMFRNQNIKENYLDDSELVHIDDKFSLKYKHKMLKENDILVTRTGYPGQACLVPLKYEGAQTFTTLIVRLKDFQRTNPKYVCYYINSISGKEYVKKMQSGAAQQNFGATALSNMPVPIPNIDIQRKIVKVLDNFESVCTDLNISLPAEIEARQKQYEYYRDMLLAFKERK